MEGEDSGGGLVWFPVVCYGVDSMFAECRASSERKSLFSNMPVEISRGHFQFQMQ